MRRPPVVLAMAGITVLALLVAVGLIIFQVNPQQDTNARNLNSQQHELEMQVRDLNGIICAQAQSTANAYRFRSLTPSGRVEPIRHFLTRMQAQRQTLRLSRGRDCAVAPGFPPFAFQLKRALEQIDKILGQFSAEQKEPISRGIGSNPNPFQVSPEFGVPPELIPGGLGENGGTPGEEGAPYIPPTGHGQPSPPPSPPPGMETTPVERQPRSAPAPTQMADTPEEDSEGPETASTPSLGETTGEAVDETTKELCTAIREVHNLC